MSASKVRSQEGMFHIQFPAKRDFWTWTELGCLSRALGFLADLFRQNVTEEVEAEEEGMYLQQLLKMVELKLLNQALHRSFNMHTADWNLCVIRKALRLLSLSVLSFEEVHNIRVAYATYEAGDMKGLFLDQRTLLRTLKMCHRVISPKKLMHRVKHMKSRLEEANRIQLYEFFDLILWCDYIEQHQGAHNVGEAEGKEKDLYNLVDFESLLSHQDQRRSRALDQRYLAEEWDFGREQLGSRHMFRGEVVYTDQRIKQLQESQLSDDHNAFSRVQTRNQKSNYRGLKGAVSQSQRRVYRAHAGSIRQRPISAPDLSMYSTPRGTPRARTTSAAAMYHSVQLRLHSASSRVLNSRLDLPERPSLPEYVRAHTPSVITSDDLDDVQLKMQMLHFDIATLETRCQVKKEEEMNFYIPEFQPPAVEDSSMNGAEKGDRRKAEHWTPDIVDKLAYPPYHLPAHHAHACDARFRGWKPADHKGRQKILTSPTFDNSPHGQLLAKQRSAMLAPVTGLHKDYVIRHTTRKEATEQQMAKRPCTAPAASPRSKPLKRLGCRSAGHYSRRSDLGQSSTTSKTTEDVVEENRQADDDDTKIEESTQSMVVKSYPDPYRKYHLEHSSSVSKGVVLKEDSSPQESSSGMVNGQAPGQSCVDSTSKSGDVDSARKEEKSLPKVSGKHGPSRRLGGSKVVDVGLIGTITLLESIQEHETEDRLSSTGSSSFSCSSPRSSSPAQEPMASRHLQDNLDQSSKSIPPGWSRLPQSPEGRKELAASHLNSWEDPKLESGVSATFREQGLKDGTPATVQVEAGSQKPKERFPQANGVGGGQDKLKWDQSSRVKGEAPVRAEQSTDLRKSRVSSAASSAMSEASDHREALTPLTSVTVTIKNKNQHVTRVINDVNDQADVMVGTGSPLGFKRSSPCITSTPRRKRASPTTTNPPRNKHAGYINPNMRKNIAANHTTNQNPTNDPAMRPESASKGLRKKNLSLLNSETDADSHLHWVQDQILAMNSACENDPQGEKENAERESDGEVKEDPDEYRSIAEEDEQEEEEKKTTIRFTKEQTFQKKREAAYRRSLLSRKASDGALKLKSYDLNADCRRRFIFNKATTRRLLHRVQDVISPELRTRIRTGNTGLKVI